MLSVRENEKLTRVGKGTPMGDLMRRYWHPIAPAAELIDEPTKKVTVLGEELVLYKNKRGGYGLIGRYCAHRRVDMSEVSIPEDDGLRCAYHGWKYDETGACIEQPFEETVRPDGRFKEKCGIAGYPAQEFAGLIWAYLGPAPVPELPRWEPLMWDRSIRDIAVTVLPCNWLQAQENSLDPVHVEWMHIYFGSYVYQQREGLRWDEITPARMPKHLKIGFDVFDHGIIKRRVVEGMTEEDDSWKIGHPILFPNVLLVGNEIQATMQWRVPIDDTHTYHVSQYIYRAAPGHEAPRQDVIPYRTVPLHDEKGKWVTNYLFNQDYMAWATQGPIANRHLEKLGESDKGIILFRKLLQEQLVLNAEGGEPMNVFRDPEQAAYVDVPLEHVTRHTMNVPQRLRRPTITQEAGDSVAIDDIRQVLDTWEQPEKVMA
jgi:5,5'-dehydrodivanillate O-demethylase